jgi:outer membrane protein assembly factor BamB
LDSDSGPALDERNGTLLFPSGHFVTAIDQTTGAVRWQAQTARSIVNASVLVVADVASRGRAFITDYDGFGSSAQLYCINTDPYDAAVNPYQPGDMVWSAPVGGSSGNTPSYLARTMGGVGLVYVASVGVASGSPGQIMAFAADAASTPPPAFVFQNVIDEGFFGGACVSPPSVPGGNPSVLSATYAFDGEVSSANLIKIDGLTGALMWSVACNRTESIPVGLPGGRIALSTGLQGYGSVPSVELFQESGGGAALVWDSAVATWVDSNGNGLMDPGEFLAVGGWTQQPVASLFAGRAMLSVGLIPAAGTFSSPSNDLFVLDLDAGPSQAGFVSQHVTGSGGSPAAAGVNLYSVGTAGLVSYGPTPRGLDVGSDGRVGTDDLYSWELGAGARDVDGDGTVTVTDRALLIQALRYGEAAAMVRGRR